MKQLSIIVPAFNRADLLEICLGNLLGQVAPGDEILVVDDASSDEARLLIERFDRDHPAIKVYRLNQNYGQGHARNHGAKLAKNSLLVFVDSDIDIGPGNLERIRTFFHEHPKASAVTGRLSLTHPHPSFFSRYKNTYMNFIFGLQDRKVNFLYGSICAIRKEDFMLWPEKDMNAEDSELGLRMHQAGKDLYFLPELEVIHFKNYDFTSLVKNDFYIPFGFARCFWLFEGWRAYLPWEEKEKFSHIQKSQVYSLICVSLGVLIAFLSLFFLGGSFSGALAVSLCVFGYLILNWRFFSFLRAHEGIGFAFLAFFWTFFDQFVMMIGALSGLSFYGTLILMGTYKGRDRTQKKGLERNYDKR